MSMWDPWHGCHRCSEGCLFCYIHKGDARRGVDTDSAFKTPRFDAPVQKTLKGEYRMKSGLCYLCFSSDFLLEDADDWRGESDTQARPLDYDWILDLRRQCLEAGTHFQFRQCGTHFIKDGQSYTLATRQLCAQAKKAGIDL